MSFMRWKFYINIEPWWWEIFNALLPSKNKHPTSPKSWLSPQTFTSKRQSSSSLLLSIFKAKKKCKAEKKEKKVSVRIPHKLVCTFEWKDNFLGEEKTLLKANRVCSCNWCWWRRERRQKLFLFRFRQLCVCGLILDFIFYFSLSALTA